MDGNALEVALGLMRLPAMRGSLRRRPLPDGVGELIELAGAVPKRIEEASGLSGEPPQLVLEAARFYVREVLLFQGADAYRVLGVEETASAARIKRHYRRLQHWLHPDRRGDDWESAFAVRINDAWGELRSPARRAAYDARRTQALARQDDGIPHRVLVNDWRPVSEGNLPWRKWMLPVAAVAGCLALVLLLVLKDDAPAPDWDVRAERAVEPERQSLADVAKAAMESMGKRRRGELDTAEPEAASLRLTPRAQQTAKHRTPQSSQQAPVPQIPARAPPEPLDSHPFQIDGAPLRSVRNASSVRDIALVTVSPAAFIDAQCSVAIAATPAVTPPLEHARLARERGRQLIK